MGLKLWGLLFTSWLHSHVPWVILRRGLHDRMFVRCVGWVECWDRPSSAA